MPKRNMGEGSAFAPITRAAKHSWRRPGKRARDAAMEEETRRPLRCDTCTKRFEPGEVIVVHKDNTHHHASCGWWVQAEPEVLSERRFVDRTRRMRNFGNTL